MQIVTAQMANQLLQNGVTKPYIVTCDDGNQYVVKFKENPESKRVLANEYVCAKIAEYLGLPLATPSFIKVSNDFINIYGQEISNHTGATITVGLHFGTKLIQKAFQINGSKILEQATNVSCIPDILLFDQLICNRDRERNGGNLLFDQQQNQIVVIDHTHAFDIGPLWDEHNLHHKLGESFRSIGANGYTYRKLIPFVRGNNPFNTILTKMSRLNDAILWDIIYNIPEEWDVTLAQKLKLKEYLVDRLNRIEQALPVLKPALPYWKGGT